MARKNLARKTRVDANVDLAEQMRRAFAGAAADRPLPTTREIAQRFGVPNTTAYRALQNLAQNREIWQHPTSGRFYPSTARALLDRPKPVACLIRRLELASEQYREMLEGISLGCGALRRTMLLWHDELLVNHPEPHDAPVFAPVAQQTAILSEFLDRHGEAAGGFVLDHVWSDEALRVHAARLKPAVVLFRTCTVEGFGNVRADLRSGALRALTYLLGRGFEQIIPIEPFAGDPAVAEFIAALEQAARETGCSDRLAPVVPASMNAQRAALIGRLRRTTKRTALLCPEDNVTLFLTTAVRDASLACPERIGLLSVMGTDWATEAGVSCLRYDYRALGRRAIEGVGSPVPVQDVLEPQLVTGSTT